MLGYLKSHNIFDNWNVCWTLPSINSQAIKVHCYILLYVKWVYLKWWKHTVKLCPKNFAKFETVVQTWCPCSHVTHYASIHESIFQNNSRGFSNLNCKIISIVFCHYLNLFSLTKGYIKLPNFEALEIVSFYVLLVIYAIYVMCWEWNASLQS